MLDIKKIELNDGYLARLSDFLQLVFHNAPHLTTDYLKWLYVDNPDGAVVGFDAFDGDIHAAHYACIPTRISMTGLQRKSLLSLNTACHPKYQKRGLFTELANRTYEAGLDEGFSCVYGVANSNSIGGFVRKLSFQNICQLDVVVGTGSLFQVNNPANNQVGFRRIWSNDVINWRINNPVNMVTVTKKPNKTEYSARALPFGICRVISEAETACAETVKHRHFSPLKLFIGKIPTSYAFNKSYFPVPKILWPSPLHFIFRNLDNDCPSINEEDIYLDFLDFDAY